MSNPLGLDTSLRSYSAGAKRTPFSVLLQLLHAPGRIFEAMVSQSNLIWLKRINFSHLWVASTRRTVPDLERMTME